MMPISRRSLLLGSATSAVFGVTAGHFGGAFAQSLRDAANLKYKTIENVENGGVLRGGVKYAGPPVEPVVMKVIKDHDICGEGVRTVVPMRVSDDNALADAVIQIKGITTGKAWASIFEDAKVYQTNCSFQPFVQIVRESAQVEVVNFDPILHNVHAYEVFKNTRRSMFSFSQPRAGQVDVVPLKLRRGNLVTIDCNAHNWMAAWIYTSPSPYLAVTTTSGEFEIKDIPPGSYELTVWHPALGEKSTQLDVGPNDVFDVDLVLS